MDIKERFQKFEIEHSNFDAVENKRCGRSDLHGFLLLEELFPGKGDILAGSDHDVVYLCFNEDQIQTLTDDQILELTRCGIFWSDEYYCLTMFT